MRLTPYRPGRMITVNMLRLLTFGGLALVRRDGTPPPRPRPQRLAILAVLAAAGSRGVSRERVSALFWPDADPERARHSLRQALYALRHELGAEVTRSEAILSIDGDVLTSDVSEFRDANAASDHERAATLAIGPFLQGFELPGSPEFDRWLEEERTILSADACRGLLQLAKAADMASDRDAAAEWWRRLTLVDPLSGRFASGYLKALAARGDRAAALAFARAHEDLVRRELEADPDPDIRRLEAELRAMPTPSVVRVAPARPVAQPAPDAVAVVQAPNDSAPAVAPPEGTVATQRLRRRRVLVSAAAGLLVLVVGVLSAKRVSAALGLVSPPATTLAVGMIREEGVPDTLRIGGVLTDMLATNLARVAGLSVLANSRLFELMVPGQDTLVAGYSTAARRAGATEILQGRLLPGPEWSLALEIQRVDLETGLVKGGYRVSAGNRYALVDSMTAAIARDLRLRTPGGSVSDATTDSPIAYRLYEEGLRAYHQYDVAAARRLMEAALQEDSTFAMAAYYHALTSFGGPGATIAGLRALRLAGRAPDLQRLMITTEISIALNDPASLSVAESLATKYSTNPRAASLLSQALAARGDWARAIIAGERAIALDSASEPVERQDCRLCADLVHVAGIYMLWDSLPATERTAYRLLRLRPTHHVAWDFLLRSAAAKGDTSAFRAHYRRFYEANPVALPPMYLPRYLILAEQYDEAGQELRTYLESPRPGEADEARWLQAIAFRNQGRYAEAAALTRLRRGTNDVLAALLALEQNDVRTAVRLFEEIVRSDESMSAPSVQARAHTWKKSLLGMSLLAANDTGRVRRLVDSVAYWGERSNYSRDRTLHHYLRGMLFVAQGRDEEAAVELREAINSPSHGFTRINHELGRVLLRLNRASEAVSVVRSALHGDIDGSNLYVTRTELHEVLAQAFDRLGMRDSAAVHYRAVARAWHNPDAPLQGRRDSVLAWLARHDAASARR